MMMVLKDIVIGLTVVTVPWAFIVALISSRLVFSNLDKFFNWRKQDRETQVRMSLWVAAPLIMGTIAWQNGVATSNYLTANEVPVWNLVQIVIYRQLFLVGAAAALWYALNRAYYPDYDLVDRLWLATVLIGLTIGVIAFLLSYFF